MIVFFYFWNKAKHLYKSGENRESQLVEALKNGDMGAFDELFRFYGKHIFHFPRGYLASAPAIDANGTPDYSKVSNAGAMRVIQTRIFDKNKNYLWPIPAIELQTNPNLEQNPGY